MSVETKVDWNELDREAREDKEIKAKKESEEFAKTKAEEMARRIAAFSDCG